MFTSKLMKRLKNRQGFSLVELLVVITIIAILSVTAYVALGGQSYKAKDSRRKDDLTTIQSALELFYAENAYYPPSLSDSSFLKKLAKAPVDPGTKGKSYAYWPNGARATKYQLGATLEAGTADQEGNLAYYQAYIVGNCVSGVDTCAVTNNLDTGYYYASGVSLSLCTTANKKIVSAKIASSNLGTDGTSTPAPGSTCVPYDPNN